MESNDHLPARVAELLAHVGRRAAVVGGVDSGLTPVQWSALRYFSRANRFSRTPSAFASFRATTRGTASATINELVRTGYLERQRSDEDGRSVHLVPTDAGERLLERDPLQSMERVIGQLGPDQQRSLAAAVPAIVGRMAEADGGPAFGTCHDCCHLARAEASDACSYYCNREAGYLSKAELDGLCVHFDPSGGPGDGVKSS